MGRSVRSVRVRRWSWRRSERPAPLGGEALGAFGAASDGDDPPLGSESALGVQLDHGPVAERLNLLGPAQPHPLLRVWATPAGELTSIQGHQHRIERRHGRRAAPLAGDGDGALVDRLGVGGRMARPWRVRSPGSGGRVVPGAWAAACTLPDYLARLLASFPPTATGTSHPAGRAVVGPLPGLVEPLSERELEVLQLLATGRSNQQIAEELVVALDTAKKHVSRILDKLGVANRTQAVARARELQLLR
jgi:DNA-binding CsgD family transcriptional regulator